MAQTPTESFEANVGIWHGWRLATGLSGNGRMVLTDGQLTLAGGNGQVILQVPASQVWACYSRFTWHGSVTLRVNGERFVVSAGGAPSRAQAAGAAVIAAGGTGGGAGAATILKNRAFTSAFAERFKAAGGNWGKPPKA